MTLQRYIAFNKVVQLNTLCDAAEALYISQPGLSNSIKNLEGELNLKLLTRNHNGVRLTEEGKKIYSYTLQIEKMHKSLLQEADNLNGLKTGIVNVGSFSSVTASWLPEIVKTMKNQYPNIEVNIFEGDYESLEQKVLSGELDCCFNTPPSDYNLNFIPLKKDELFCIVSKELSLSKKDTVSIKELSQYPFIKPKKNWDNEIKDLFKSYNLKPHVKYEVSEDSPILALVEANLGINIRPSLVLDFQNRSSKIKKLKIKEDAYRMLGICTTSNPSHATHSFISIAKRLCSD